MTFRNESMDLYSIKGKGKNIYIFFESAKGGRKDDLSPGEGKGREGSSFLFSKSVKIFSTNEKGKREEISRSSRHTRKDKNKRPVGTGERRKKERSAIALKRKEMLRAKRLQAGGKKGKRHFPFPKCAGALTTDEQKDREGGESKRTFPYGGGGKMDFREEQGRWKRAASSSNGVN